MNLTKRQREILEGLASGDEDKDFVQDGIYVYFGNDPSSVRTVYFFLRHALIKGDDLGGMIRYEINEWGRRALSDPDFEPQIELMALQDAIQLQRELEAENG